MLPVVVSLMGAPGTDTELIRWTLDALHESGRITKVRTGKVAFDPSGGGTGRFKLGRSLLQYDRSGEAERSLRS